MRWRKRGGVTHLNKNSSSGGSAVGQHRPCSTAFQAEEMQETRPGGRNNMVSPRERGNALPPSGLCSSVI